MPHWTEIARRNHQRANRVLARAVSRSAISVPIGDSDVTAPGFLHYGHFYSCVPDVQYPWDADVLRAIREIVPDAMPVVIRSVWRWSNYHEHGKLGEPLVLVRHGIARAIRNPTFETYDYACVMPSTPTPGLLIPGRTLSECVPNYVETSWHDREDRPYGYDLPGVYLPFSWRLYHAYREAEETRVKALRQSLRDEDDEGNVIARGAARESLEGEQATTATRKASRADNAAHVQRDIDRYYNIEPSEVEMKEKLVGTA